MIRPALKIEAHIAIMSWEGYPRGTRVIIDRFRAVAPAFLRHCQIEARCIEPWKRPKWVNCLALDIFERSTKEELDPYMEDE